MLSGEGQGVSLVREWFGTITMQGASAVLTVQWNKVVPFRSKTLKMGGKTAQ
jgi:hypothetical protein